MNSPSSPLLPHTRPCPSSVVSRNSTYTHWPNQELGRNLHSFLSLPLSPLNPLKYLLLLSKCLPEPSRPSLSRLPLCCWNGFSNRMIQLWSPGQNLQGDFLTYRTNLHCPVWYTRRHLRFGPAHVSTCPVVFPALPHTVTSHQILMLRALYQGSIPLPALFSLPNHRRQLLYLGNSCSSFTPQLKPSLLWKVCLVSPESCLPVHLHVCIYFHYNYWIIVLQPFCGVILSPAVCELLGR